MKENKTVIDQNGKCVKMESDEVTTERALAFGKELASPLEGEEICISGIAGYFPDSDSVFEFGEKLLNKVDLVTHDNRRWDLKHPEIPNRTGKINKITKFDTGFFGVHYRQANAIDPMVRLLLERTVEAIIDAGLNPEELEGTKTGVYIGVCSAETEGAWFFNKLEAESFAVAGCTRSMVSHWISYFLKLEGPSFIIDTACSSSLFALNRAYVDLRSGKCDQAIVAGSSICLHPYVSLQFARLGVLSPDGTCKCFDRDANGYARSEAACAMLLQKAKDCKRIYAQVVHSQTNCDGFKEKGITYPSGSAQSKLLEEVYEECGIPRNLLSFVEAHGTGTKVGDPEELTAIDDALCKHRDRPLLIGSIKCNIGHTEPASGVCSVAKVLIGMERGYIPPNIHYQNPNEAITALKDRSIVVVTEKTPWQDKTVHVGVNSFGFGGANCHVLLRWNGKEKVASGKPKDDLPRLVCVSGRVKEAISSIVDHIAENGMDVELIGLVHRVFRKEIKGHIFRGYEILGKGLERKASVAHFSQKKHLHLIFGDVRTGWTKLAKDLFAIPHVAASFQRIHNILCTKDVNITGILTNSCSSKNLFNHLLETVVLQVILVDLLKDLDIQPEKVAASSIGIFASIYFEEQLDLEKTLLCAYYVGYFLNETFKNNHISSDDQTQFQNGLLVCRSNILNKFNQLIDNQTDTTGEGCLVDKLINGLQKTTIEIPYDDSIVLQIGAINANFNSETTVLDIESNPKTNGVVHLLEVIGRLYESGHNVNIASIYPKVQFPVSRGTPMLAQTIKWNHNDDWFVSFYKANETLKSGERIIHITMNDSDFSFVGGHMIDGRILFPATGYIYLIMETMSLMLGLMISNIKLVFEDVKFKRATTMSKDKKMEFIVMVQRGSGNFEVIEGGAAVVSGKVYFQDDFHQETLALPVPPKVDENQYLPLSEKDIYKELKLRGYNYSGIFRGLKECDTSASEGKVLWNGNWISFMDSMMQMQILQVDTRNLYVPTSIKKLTIDTNAHIAYAQQFEEDSLLPVYINSDAHTIRCGGIQLIQMMANSINRRRPLGDPVLEKYVFVPNESHLSKDEAMRVNLQLALENNFGVKVKVIEVIDGTVPENSEPLAPLVLSVLGDLPLIQAEMIIMSNREYKLQGVTVDNSKLRSQSEALLVIVNSASTNLQLLEDALHVMKPDGYILSRESKEFTDGALNNEDLVVLTSYKNNEETLVLLKKKPEYHKPMSLKITNDDYSLWLGKLQNATKSNKRIIIYAQGEDTSGILGLFNCIRREPSGNNVRCVFIKDSSAPEFNISDELYYKQLQKDLAVNVFENGTWGTYRHLLINEKSTVEVEQCYIKPLINGDLSSLAWVEGSLTMNTVLQPEQNLVSIYYTALNFRDVMTATNRITADAVTMDRMQQDCVTGVEYVGRTKDGKRVMGGMPFKVMATMAAVHRSVMIEIPDHWSMEEAATITGLYMTIVYGLLMRTQIKRGDSILIHAGSGGIGQAAIHMCLTIGCNVFTTVSTQQKRDFLLNEYPQLKASHIGNSRDTSFEQMVMKQTKGRGVDFVLNSLTDEKLLASVRCLAPGGNFVEIGKVDLVADSPLGMILFSKGCSFHAVMIDRLLMMDPHDAAKIADELRNAITKGLVKPLPRHLYEPNELEQAFRFMAAGKHMGKIVFKLREEEEDKVVKPERRLFSAVPRYLCDENFTYIITGGLGGFGLELTDWIILRGAKKVVLSSRTGIKNGYQAYRIRIWRSYGVTVKISTADIGTRDGCRQLLEEAIELGPVKSIFNLAVVLRDNILENQTVDNFDVSFKPKARATQYFDELSRTLCPELKDFVVFSSVSCGRGNAGQTNYGMANSIMERICEKRKKEGLPALAIQWGAVGDVGLVADMQENFQELEIGGTLQQRITNCLNCMDIFLRQSEPIVSSMVVAEKKAGYGAADNVVDCVANIMGIHDLRTVSLHSTLAELGMDSMTAVEIKQTLEREFEVFLTPQDLRSLTFARLQDIKQEKEADAANQEFKLDIENLPEGARLLLRRMGDENMSTNHVVRLTSLVEEDDVAPTVILFPGLEGMASIMEPLAENLFAHTICTQYCYDEPEVSIPKIAERLFPLVLEYLSPTVPFYLIGYSYGSLIALEFLKILEEQGYKGKAIIIDGSPHWVNEIVYHTLPLDETLMQTEIICAVMSLYMPLETVIRSKEPMAKCSSMDERLQILIDFAPADSPYSPEFQKKFGLGIYQRMKYIREYKKTYESLTTSVRLFRPNYATVQNISTDYDLSKWTGSKVEVTFFQGNHYTILENKELHEEINKWLNVVVAPVDGFKNLEETEEKIGKSGSLQIANLPYVEKEKIIS